MAHNLDFTGGRANMAFVGNRNDIWHRLGQQMQPGQSMEEWIKQAGLDWHAIKVPALAALEGAQWDHIDAGERFQRVPDRFFVCRGDNGVALGGNTVSEVYQPVQPRECFEFFDRYISVDERFSMDTAGSLKGGAIIWAMARFNGDLSVAGEKHLVRMLMTTTFDASGATRNQMTTTRVVCNNTLDVATSDSRANISTRHNTKFDAKRVGEELSQLAQSVVTFKAVGDAMAQHTMTQKEISDFFKTCLDIPFDVPQSDISTRKLNQFSALGAAYRTSVREGAERETAWSALQAITRYVDHDRTSDKSGDEKKLLSAQFGSGAAMKGKAMDILLPRIKDKVPLLVA